MNINLLNYKIWADQRTLQAIEKVDADTFPDSYAFMLQQLNHMLIVEDLFRSRLMNQAAPHESTNMPNIPGYGELRARLLISGEWYQHYAANLSSEELNSTIKFTFADSKTGSMSAQEILSHIVNHSSYHRGSIAHALDLAGVPHPPDGYAIYIHENEPERRR